MQESGRKYHPRKSHLEITDQNELFSILKAAKYLTVSFVLPDGEPYMVILNHGYDKSQHCIYFHTGFNGRKIEALRHQPKVCAIALDDQGYMMGKCHHKYRSVMVFGTISEISEPSEKLYALTQMFHCLENNPQQVLEYRYVTEQMVMNINMLKLDIENISGKADPGW